MATLKRQHLKTSPLAQGGQHAAAARRLWERVRGRWLLAALLFVLALLPRLTLLAGQSLWLDEGGTWQAIQATWPTLLNDLFRREAAYPLYHVLLKGWVLLAGDSEWALRLPSAVAGAAAVVVIYFAALELLPAPPDERPRWFALLAAVLLFASPFAIWYAQEAKVYSLLLLLAVLLLWSYARALRLHTWQAWLLFGGVALVSVFVHRLAVLLLLAAWVAWLLNSSGRWWVQVAGWLAAVLAGWYIVTAMADVLPADISATGAAIPAGPLAALRLALLRFMVDRGPGEFPAWWLLPWALLALWGGALLLYDSIRASGARTRGARVLLCFLLVPTVLFLAQLWYTRLYESRYLMIVYPAWILLLAYPFSRAARWQPAQWAGRLRAAAGALLVMAALLVNWSVLVQPGLGLFSGDPVKEQYREAMEIVAQRVHPDDAVLLHPAYLQPLYSYYMQRLTPDPVPAPLTFEAFKHRQQQFNQRDWNDARKAALAGYTRSFLIIAPMHARTVDRPLTEDDEYGLVGLYYQFPQNKWTCGVWRPSGVHVFCQDSPEAYETGEPLRPETPLQVEFGEALELQGYTLKATTPAGSGVYRAGGTLPITLFWEVLRETDTRYRMFLHLCRDCDTPPAAALDGPPLEGYLPTNVWTLHNPVHDERAVPLPADLPPGRYTLLLGVYPAGNPAEEARLSVQGGETLAGERLVLDTVEIVAP